MAEQSVVSVVALEISDGKESEFLALTGQMQGLVRRKGYGTNQLLRDGSHPRRYYDIRIWRNAESAAQAESDGEIKGLRRDLADNICTRHRWSTWRGRSRWGSRLRGRGRSGASLTIGGCAQRRSSALAFEGPDRRLVSDRRVGLRRADELSARPSD